jgi:hypothetical protein
VNHLNLPWPDLDREMLLRLPAELREALGDAAAANGLTIAEELRRNLWLTYVGELPS